MSRVRRTGVGVCVRDTRTRSRADRDLEVMGNALRVEGARPSRMLRRLAFYPSSRRKLPLKPAISIVFMLLHIMYTIWDFLYFTPP